MQWFARQWWYMPLIQAFMGQRQAKISLSSKSVWSTAQVPELYRKILSWKPPTLLPTPPPEKKKNVVTCCTRWYMPKIRISGKIQGQAHPGYIVSSNQVWARLSQMFKNIPVASQCHKIKFTLHDGIFDSRSVLAQFPYAKKDFTFFQVVKNTKVYASVTMYINLHI